MCADTDTHTYLYFLVKNQDDDLLCCGAVETSLRIYLVILKLSLNAGGFAAFTAFLNCLPPWAPQIAGCPALNFPVQLTYWLGTW